MTSHDLVDVIRRLYGTRRVGHTGTLDPAASGLMLMVLGTATRIARFLSAQDKTYRASVRLGATSDTGDGQGRINDGGPVPELERERLAELLREFTGTVQLDIPDYASARVDGYHRYELARQGRVLPPAQQTVVIHDLSLLDYRPPVVELRVRCSSGTYIRSLATAVGRAVGCGAYLDALRRECIGECRIEDAFTLDELDRRSAQGRPLPQPQSVEEFLPFPMIEIDSQRADAVRNGQMLDASDLVDMSSSFVSGDTVVLCIDHRVAAIVTALFDSRLWPQQLPGPGAALFRYQRVLLA